MSSRRDYFTASDLSALGLSGWICELQFEVLDPHAGEVGHGAVLAVPLEDCVKLEDWVPADLPPGVAPSLDRLGFSITALASEPWRLCVTGPAALSLGGAAPEGAVLLDGELFVDARALRGELKCEAKGFPCVLVVKTTDSLGVAVGVFSPPFALPETPEVSSPVLEWVDRRDAWLVDELEVCLAEGSAYAQVAAVGLHLRLRRLDPTRFAAILTGEAPEEGRERAWARPLLPEQRAGLDRLAHARASLLRDDLLDLLGEALLDDPEWWARLAEALCRRDELEGVLTLLLEGGRAELLESCLAAIDAFAAATVRALPGASSPCEHLARAATLEPEAWWVAPFVGD